MCEPQTTLRIFCGMCRMSYPTTQLYINQSASMYRMTSVNHGENKATSDTVRGLLLHGSQKQSGLRSAATLLL